mmetsp:Transcript_10148/g.12811  ORF Transcript_10148/g.12811 Transcript_10148/m.12811 type:complete len:125 (+) Transcript_10148:165-539(+)
MASLKQESKPAAEETSPFVNVGLQKWELGRHEWLSHNQNGAASGSGGAPSPPVDQQRCLPSSKKKKKGATNLNIDKIVQLIVSNRWRLATKGGQREKEKATFEKPVPLPQMVEILVDLWEAEER